ncbi:hypothetical protein LUZ60_006492 [Juncus effusus]|nr:hypothetical protein LUZ60_006492 [Juncus effusus]
MTSRSSSSSTVEMHQERLESNGISATIPCQKDKIYIEKLERELQNCYQEIDYLQDQLNLRSSQANFMGEQVHSLELKLSELEKINQTLKLMENGLERPDSQYLILIEELKYKEEKLNRSVLQVQRLEMTYLDSQCEIESLKLEMNEMEQRIFESREAISRLETENKKLELYGIDSSRSLFSQFEFQLEKLIEKMRIHVGIEIDESFLLDIRKEFQFSDCLSNFEESLDSLLSKIAMISAYDQNMKDEIKKMRDQIQESELLIEQLKEELLEEKRRAKEDSEDLTQEMAELRYQMKGMLDEEYKRRALIEQASIKRIKQLDQLLLKEQQKATSAVKRYHEAHELAERQYLEIKKLKNALEKLHSGEKCCKAQRIDSCTCGFCAVSSSSKGPENENAESSKQNLIEWYSNSTSSTDN